MTVSRMNENWFSENILLVVVSFSEILFTLKKLLIFLNQNISYDNVFFLQIKFITFIERINSNA